MCLHANLYQIFSRATKIPQMCELNKAPNLAMSPSGKAMKVFPRREKIRKNKIGQLFEELSRCVPAVLFVFLSGTVYRFLDFAF